MSTTAGSTGAAAGADPAAGRFADHDAWASFCDRWVARARADALLATAAAQASFAVAWRYGPHACWMRFTGGRLTDTAAGFTFDRNADVVLRAPGPVWDRTWQAIPPPHYQGLFALLMRCPDFAVDGDRRCFAQHARVLRRLTELARAEASPTPSASSSGAEPDPAPAALERIRGGYVTVELRGHQQSLSVDETVPNHPEHEPPAGTLLFLHTAGSDARQYHRLMTHPELRDRWRMVAFDLPAHGRSAPPAGLAPGAWRLDTELYVASIMAVVDRLGLESPVAVGSSMGGQICLELAARHPDRFAGVVACQAADRIEGRTVRWAGDPRVNESVFVPEWIHDLMAPTSPQACRDEVWWHYGQGGHGVFRGDIDFYSREWDARDRVARIDTRRCPVIMLTGEYDYSCTPAISAATAARIPGARFTVMRNLGHFPMAENPDRFLGYLLPALHEIRARQDGG